MLPSVQLPAGVSTQDCLSWSSDGELAVAAGEEVYFLIPRHDDGDPWTQLRIRVNAFTFEEWPMREPASFTDMSVGEEQARVSIVSLAWSPPGLAKHRRSVLAVLTTNLLLSIWAPGPDPTDTEGWQRVLILNETAIPSYNLLDSSTCSFQRVRSMAWAPVCHQHAEANNPLSTRKWGVPILTVADDKNTLYFLTVSSPFSDPSKPWDVQTLAYETLPAPHRGNERPSLLQMALSSKHFINEISFGSWSIDAQIPVSSRSFGIQYNLMFSLSFDPQVQAIISSSTSHVDTSIRWTFNVTFPKCMELSIETLKRKYATEHHLRAEKVTSKTWGTASFGDVIALCITCHPIRIIEYQAFSEGPTNILFENSAMRNASQSMEEFPWQETPQIETEEVRRSILLTTLNYSSSSPDLLGPNGQSLHITLFDRKIINAASCASTTDSIEGTLQISSGVETESTVQETQAEGRLSDDCPFCGVGLSTGDFSSFSNISCPSGHPFGM